MSIKISTEIEVNPKLLAEMFCKMNSSDQAKVLNNIAKTFHSWGNDGYMVQIDGIATDVTLRYAAPFISDLNHEIELFNKKLS